MLRLTSVISLLKLIQNTSMHETRVSSSGNMSKTSRLNLNQDSFSKFEAKLWNEIPNEFRELSKGALKKHFS